MGLLTKTDAEAVLSQELKTQDFELVGCEDKSIDNISIGYLSSSGKAKIIYRLNGITYELHVFFKRLPEQESHRKVVELLGGCHKEAVVFNKFLNLINFEGEKRFFPKCYLAESNDVVVLEDLAEQGYKNLPALQCYDIQHCKKTIDSIAKLHAASFIFERKHNCKLTEYISDLKWEVIFSTNKNHPGNKRYLVGNKALKIFTKIYFPYTDEETQKKAFEFMDILPNKLHPSDIYPNVFTHSDLWSNNIMFHYDKEGNVDHACLIDFQCSTYRPPSFDVQLFLYCCTSRDFRQKHYTAMMKYYFDGLSQILNEKGIELESFMNWGHFDSMSQETLPLALALAPQFVHFAAMPDSIIKPIMLDEERWMKYYQEDRDDIVLQATRDDLAYKNKLIEGMNDLLAFFS